MNLSFEKEKRLNYAEITSWFATGFFLDNQSFQKKKQSDISVIQPSIDWLYNPKNESFEEFLNSFTEIFESLVIKNTENKKIILPLSGGLDSRTLAASLIGNKNVVAYSYEFPGGVHEVKYAKEIADVCGWEFHSFKIPNGYLWKDIEKISKINKCRTEFTHPRQIAVIEKVSSLGDILLSGSMGDLLFDNFNIIRNENQITSIKKQMLKPGGLELATDLWAHWKLNDSFESFFNNKIKTLNKNINIPNLQMRIRAFKSMYYVRNWTNINMKFFSNYKETYAPYHDNKMCNFVCTIPEKFLKNRKIQIEYIKNKAPDLAKIKWQKYDLDLYSYKKFNSSYLPKRLFRISKRLIKEKFLRQKPLIERNWEIQFRGSENELELKDWLFNNPFFRELIPDQIISKYYLKFKNDNPIKYSHCISMLLTFSVWSKEYFNND